MAKASKKTAVAAKAKAMVPAAAAGSTNKRRKRKQAAAEAKKKLVTKISKQRQAASEGIFGISGLTAELSSASSEPPARRATVRRAAKAGGRVTSNSARRQVAASESAQMQAVLANPAFIADPLAALTEHLSNTTAARKKAAEKVR